MATLYYAEHVHIAQTRIPTPYFCVGQEPESESVPESVSDNVNEPFLIMSRDSTLKVFVIPALKRQYIS